MVTQEEKLIEEMNKVEYQDVVRITTVQNTWQKIVPKLMTTTISPLSVQYRPTSTPHSQGMVHIRSAAVNTMGVYRLAKESTNFSVGERFDCASSTKRINRDTAESSTVEVVRITSLV